MVDTEYRKYGNVQCPACLFVKTAILELSRGKDRRPVALRMGAHNNRAKMQCDMSGAKLDRDQWPDWALAYLED